MITSMLSRKTYICIGCVLSLFCISMTGSKTEVQTKAPLKKEKVLKEEYADGAYTVLCETGKALRALSSACAELAEVHEHVLNDLHAFVQNDGSLTRAELQTSIEALDEWASTVHTMRVLVDQHAQRLKVSARPMHPH